MINVIDPRVIHTLSTFTQSRCRNVEPQPQPEVEAPLESVSAPECEPTPTEQKSFWGRVWGGVKRVGCWVKENVKAIAMVVSTVSRAIYAICRMKCVFG